MTDFRDYKTVQRWLAEPPGRGFQPVREDPQAKVDVLEKFCAHIGIDPDTLIATCTDLIPTGKAERNVQLKALKVWIKAQRALGHAGDQAGEPDPRVSSSRTASRS